MTDKFEKYAIQLKNEKLFETEELYQKNFNDYASIFQKHFLGICENITHLQQSGTLGEIAYLEYTLLYTNLLQKKETAEVRAYNGNWYLDNNQLTAGEFDFSPLFIKYRELWTDLFAARKRFAGAVASHEIKSFLLSCARSFYRYVIAVCRFSILPCIESELFQSINRTEKFEINIGEYMAYTEAVYKEDQTRTSMDALDWLSLHLEYEYAFEDFSELDFSKADLSGIDLRYSDLRRCQLKGTDFQDSMLSGARFCHASMEDADLRNCLMHEADFTGANLANARFTAARSHAGIAPEQSSWKSPGYRPVSFRNANLTNADFRNTNIKNADFTGALMAGALFQQKQLGRFKFSEEQMRDILQHVW